MSLKIILVSTFVTIGVLLGSFSATAADDPAKNPARFSLGVTGSMSGNDPWTHVTMLEFVKVQDLFLAIAEKPRDRTFVVNALDGLPFGLDEIMSQRLLHEDNGLYFLNFNFLTQEDQKKIYDVSEKYAASLTKAFINRWDEFDRIFDEFEQPGVTESYLAYAVVGLMALDWDGLDLTRQKGFRPTEPTFVDAENSYTPWAKENGDEFTVKELFWGSHNQATRDGEFTYTSFGDHFSLPRHGIPDIFWRSITPLKDTTGDLRRLTQSVNGDALFTLYSQYANLIQALKSKPSSLADIMNLMGWSQQQAADHVNFLLEIQVLEERDGHYLAVIPVLENNDAGMVRRARVLAWDIMGRWLDENHDTLKADLSGLAAVKQGVPFGVMFTEIWHFVFGITNRDLVHAGYFADPYGEDRHYKGFLQIVWQNGVYKDFDVN